MKSFTKFKKFFLIIGGIILALAGIAAAAFPTASKAYYDYSKDALISRWNEYVKEQEPPENRLSLSLAQTGSISLNNDGLIEEDAMAIFNIDELVKEMAGVVTIEKISLVAPILTGIDASNLSIGICELLGSQSPGNIGNYCLAGHKSKIYGKQFNRLIEVDLNDELKIYNGYETFIYEVYDRFTVKAEEAWPLENVYNDSIITLVTSDYTQTPIGRFIVKARLVNSATAASAQ
ncbi:MAG: class D sortase [Clostridiales bacterium]|jgi:sortase A|nr:class D sortase [Clostridiales bacterium]